MAGTGVYIRHNMRPEAEKVGGFRDLYDEDRQIWPSVDFYSHFNLLVYSYLSFFSIIRGEFFVRYPLGEIWRINSKVLYNIINCIELII